MTCPPDLDEPRSAAALAERLAHAEGRIRFDLPEVERRLDGLLLEAGALAVPELLMRARLLQADVLERRGDVVGSVERAREVNGWAGEHGRRTLLARSHYVLAAVFQDLGDAAMALEHAVRAVDLLDDDVAAETRVDHLVRLADAIAMSGSLAAARERFDDVLTLTQELGDVDRELVVLNNRAYAEVVAGAYAEGLVWSERMQALAERHGMALHIGRLETVARALAGTGHLERAEALMLPALDPDALRAVPDGDAAAECLLTLAEVQRRRGALDHAERTLQTALERCDRQGLAASALRARQEQAELRAARGDFEGAYALHRQFHAEWLALQSDEREARARALQAVYETTEARRQSRRYRELSLRDPLTGLYNRRHVDEQLPLMLRRAAEAGHPLTLALADLDHFKNVNDNRSHDTGDAVLKLFARAAGSRRRRRRRARRPDGRRGVPARAAGLGTAGRRAARRVPRDRPDAPVGRAHRRRPGHRQHRGRRRHRPRAGRLGAGPGRRPALRRQGRRARPGGGRAGRLTAAPAGTGVGPAGAARTRPPPPAGPPLRASWPPRAGDTVSPSPGSDRSTTHLVAVADLAGEDRPGQLVADRRLHHPAQRAGAVDRVVAGERQPLPRRVGHGQRQPPTAQPLGEQADLQVDDPRELLGGRARRTRRSRRAG